MVICWYETRLTQSTVLMIRYYCCLFIPKVCNDPFQITYSNNKSPNHHQNQLKKHDTLTTLIISTFVNSLQTVLNTLLTKKPIKLADTQFTSIRT